MHALERRVQRSRARPDRASTLRHDLLNDPYSAVRYIAYRSLRGLPGFGDLAYDFVGTPRHREQARVHVGSQWMARRPSVLDRTGAAVLIDDAGELDLDALDRLSRLRDDRPVDLAE